MARCPDCAGELKIIAAILEQPVTQKIPTHLGLQAWTPARRQAPQAAWLWLKPRVQAARRAAVQGDSCARNLLGSIEAA